MTTETEFDLNAKNREHRINQSAGIFYTLIAGNCPLELFNRSHCGAHPNAHKDMSSACFDKAIALCELKFRDIEKRIGAAGAEAQIHMERMQSSNEAPLS